MGVYVIRSKSSLVEGLSLGGRKLGADSRSRQYGTPPAAAIAAGVAALIPEQSSGNSLSVADLREQLLSRCAPLDDDRSRQGRGVVQVGASS